MELDLVQDSSEDEFLDENREKPSLSVTRIFCKHQCQSKTTTVICVFVWIILVVGIALVLILTNPGVTLSTAVKFTRIRDHLAELQNIASNHSNSRSVLNGYNDSAEYVANELERFGFSVTRQYFPLYVWTELQSPQLSIQSADYTALLGTDFASIAYSGSGVASGSVVLVINGGCLATDWDDFPAGSLALVSSADDCAFAAVQQAQVHGAGGFLFGTESSSLATASLRPAPDQQPLAIPVLAVSSALMRLLNTSSARLSVLAETTLTYSYNVLADSPFTTAEAPLILMGAHLDSVDAGPGINDNGSGSAVLLEIALQFADTNLWEKKKANGMRFAWWAAEELGLLGSTYYVQQLQANAAAWEQLTLYLNFDMMASPNYIIQIQNGTWISNQKALSGSVALGALFSDYFEKQQIPFSSFPMQFPGSDFFPFSDAGKPSNGLVSGANRVKTTTQRDEFGGLAGAALDPCYHAACDTIDNINTDCLMTMTAAAATVIQSLFEGNLTQLLGS